MSSPWRRDSHQRVSGNPGAVQPFGDLWVDHNTLDMIRDSFAVLLRIIWKVAQGQEELEGGALVGQAVRDARSILGEFASQSYNPTFEKY